MSIHRHIFIKKKKKTEKRTHPLCFENSTTCVFSFNFNRYKIKTWNNDKPLGFFFNHSSGCIPIELTSFFLIFHLYTCINQYMYGFMEKTFEFLQVYKDIEFMNANQ